MGLESLVSKNIILSSNVLPNQNTQPSQDRKVFHYTPPFVSLWQMAFTCSFKMVVVVKVNLISHSYGRFRHVLYNHNNATSSELYIYYDSQQVSKVFVHIFFRCTTATLVEDSMYNLLNTCTIYFHWLCVQIRVCLSRTLPQAMLLQGNS